jgi:hypothetical protein
MAKRILAAFLWFYAGWYGGNLLADFLGLSLVLGPIIGAAAAFLIVGDPRRIIWKATTTAQSTVKSIAANSYLAPADDEVTRSV